MKFELKRLLIIVFLCVTTFLGVLAGHTYNAIYAENDLLPDSTLRIITITPGMTVQEVALQLENAGVIERSRDFTFAAGFLDFEGRIQAGEYFLPFGESNRKLLSRLVNAGSSANLVTIPEGYTARQIAKLLRKKIGLDSTAFMCSVYDSSLIKRYEIDAPSFEGFLFPDSYNFYLKMSAVDVIDLMVKRFFQVYDSTMRTETEKIGLSLNDLVTLASIIEGEMTFKSEAPSISAVYHNRLKNRMRLQADPTIQYIVKNGPRRLYNGDLAINSPYNTYIYRGLPPGPVCNPSIVALKAALNPAEEPYLYLVANGDGSHSFNVKFKDHLKAKARLDSIRADVAKRRRSSKQGN